MSERVVGEWTGTSQALFTVPSHTTFLNALSRDVSETLSDMHNYKTVKYEMNCGSAGGELAYEK